MTTPHFQNDQVTLYNGSCIDVMRELPDASVHAVVTDPPYGLANTDPAKVADTVGRWLAGDREYLPAGKGFMGAQWDAFVPPPVVWDEALRILKPGGHLLAFAGSRTFDLMSLSIRLAGFDIRDGIAWLYGSGFPKNLDVSAAMETYLADGPQEVAVAGRIIREGVYDVTAFLREARDAAGWNNTRIDAMFGTNGMAGHWTSKGTQPAVPSVRQWAELKQALGFGDEMDDLVARLASIERPEDWGATPSTDKTFLGTLARNPDAAAAGSWGTALKPAFEPVVVARKAITGTVSANVLTHGTGALSIGANRVGDEARWPSNVMLDESQAEELERQTAGIDGGGARYFYVAKAPTSERPEHEGTMHATVKPLDLMQRLVRLVTPPGGTVLEPFAGSGTTLEACLREGFSVIGIEREADYIPLIMKRIRKDHSQALFTLDGAA